MGWFSRESDSEWDRRTTKDLMPAVDEEFSSRHPDPESLNEFYNDAVNYFGKEKADEEMPNVAAWFRITR